MTSLGCSQVPWCPPGAEWYYTYLDAMGPEQGYAHLTNAGDTTINSITCQKIQGKIYHSFTSVPSVFPMIITYMADNKVWFLNNGNFSVLYDFSVIAGGSWQVTLPYSFYGLTHSSGQDSITTITVDSVKTVNLNGTFLKQLWTHSSTPWLFEGPITEAIGCRGFMLPGNWGLWDPPVFGTLRCYRQPGFAYTLLPPCDTIISGIPVNQKLNLPRIFPNPVHSNLVIEFDGILQYLAISDLRGNTVVESGFIQNACGHYSIDLYGIVAGCYFLGIRINNTSYYMKIFKY